MTDERMKAIFELDVTKKFVLELFKFVSSFSILEERLKAEIAARDHSACFKTAMEICAGLKKIYAGDFADEFYQAMQLMRKKEHEEIEMYMADFLVYVAMFTINIQMALFEHNTEKVAKRVETSKSAIAQKLPLEKELILAVDDTMVFLVTLRSYLKDTGFNLINHASIEDTLEFLMKRRPALIFLDVDMPKLKLNGFELSEKIRMLGHDAPIVFITSNASEKNVIKAMDMGAAGFIVKPANQNSILQILEKLIGLPEKPEPPKPAKKPDAADLPELPDLPELSDLPPV